MRLPFDCIVIPDTANPCRTRFPSGNSQLIRGTGEPEALQDRLMGSPTVPVTESPTCSPEGGIEDSSTANRMGRTSTSLPARATQ